MPPATAGHPGDRPGVAALYAFPVAPLTRRASPATRSALADRVAPTFSAGWLADSRLPCRGDQSARRVAIPRGIDDPRSARSKSGSEIPLGGDPLIGLVRRRTTADQAPALGLRVACH